MSVHRDVIDVIDDLKAALLVASYGALGTYASNAYNELNDARNWLSSGYSQTYPTTLPHAFVKLKSASEPVVTYGLELEEGV